MACQSIELQCYKEPALSVWVDDMDKRIGAAMETGINLKHFRGGDNAVIVTGWRAGAGFTNIMRIVTIPHTEPHMIKVLSATFGKNFVDDEACD